MVKRIVLFSVLITGYLAEAKILIFTYAYNRPDFIEVQYKTFKKFLHNDYEFVVFSDAKEVNMSREIQQMCANYGIRCIPIPQEIHNRPYLPRLPGENYNAPAVRNCNVVQYSLNEYGFDHDDILLLIDSDCFLVRDLNVRNFMRGYDIGGISQGIGYLWIGLVFMDMAHMPNKNTINFNCGRINGVAVDAGGHSYKYLKENPKLKIKSFGPCYPQKHRNDMEWLKEHFNKIEIAFVQSGVQNIEYFADNHFLHYRGGTNWDKKSAGYHTKKTNQLNDYIEALLNT